MNSTQFDFSSFELVSYDELPSSTPEHASYLIDGLFLEDSVVLLSGKPKKGKSVLATNLAMAVATGNPWLERPTKGGTVLWFCYEETRHQRAEILRSYNGQSPNLAIAFDPPLIDTEEGLTAIEELISIYAPKLIVIDTLAEATQDSDFDHVGPARRKLQGIVKLAAKMHVSFLVVHHLNKGNHERGSVNGIAGSHQLAATAAAHWNYHLKSESNGTRRIEVDIVGVHGRLVGNVSLALESRDVAAFILAPERSKKIDSRRKTPVSIIQAIEMSSSAGCLQDEIMQQTGYSRSAVSKALTRLLEAGKIGGERLGRSIRYYTSAIDARQYETNRSGALVTTGP